MLATGIDIFVTAQNLLVSLGHCEESLSKLGCTYVPKEKSSLNSHPSITFTHQFLVPISSELDLSPLQSILTGCDLHLRKRSDIEWILLGNDLGCSYTIANEEDVQSLSRSIAFHLEIITNRYAHLTKFEEALQAFIAQKELESQQLAELYPLQYIGDPDYSGNHFHYATIDRKYGAIIAFDCMHTQKWYFYGGNNSGIDKPHNSLWTNKMYESEEACVFAAQIWIAKNAK
jgi:hypothetical protein